MVATECGFYEEKKRNFEGDKVISKQCKAASQNLTTAAA